MKRTHLVLIAILMALSVLFLIGCDEGKDRVMIGSILDRPNHYFDREVVVAGRVCSTHGANLLVGDAGVYQIDDGTGRIWIITHRDVPYVGDEVGLKGRVDGGIRIFGERFGVVIRERDRRIQHRSDGYYLDRDRDRYRNRDRDRDECDQDRAKDRDYYDKDRDRNRNYDRDYDRSYDRDRT